MALNIKNAEADRLAHQLAEVTGDSLTTAVITALRSRLAGALRQRQHDALRGDIAGIQAFVASLPDRDTRGEDEILDYDGFGIPRQGD